ncbi:FAD-binding oxidoreductase [Bradyrhizobium lablabi]|nr:FAD-binding oxidoreductase [Bradyrhizobium lablabi]
MALPDFSCPVYRMGDPSYWKFVYQYATTSNPAANMSPAAIICPQHPNADPDVKKAILYAAANGIGVAVRTGGHAYSGTSSTTSNNIQLDLSEAYSEWEYDTQTGLLRLGISYSLLEFNNKLREAGLFMPTGQCYNVHVGGHVQTGGYGQLARAFGLFSDQLVSFEIFLADGSKKTIAVDSPVQADRDLFFAVLGGGPGNYGIVTHITIRPGKDADHKYSRAYKYAIPYDPAFDHGVLVQLFDLVRQWENAPGDYDFCFSVVAAEDDFLENFLGIASRDDFMVKFFGGRNTPSPLNALMIYFQYSNLDNTDTYDPSWCKSIKTILATAKHGSTWWERFKEWAEQELIDLSTTLRDDNVITPISESVTQLWTYYGTREFNYPFLKNGQVTDKVATSGWAEWAATRIDALVGRSSDGLMVFVQCQNFGGENSAVTKNGKRKQTSYAWRNTTVGYNLDVFYNTRKQNALTLAQEWQNINIAEGVGPNGRFSTTDHRWFWASHGDLDMSKVWPFYYSTDDYAKCCQVKQTVDPHGVFTANTFVVGYSPETAPEHVAAAPRDVATARKPEEVLDDAAFAKGHADRARLRAQAKGIATAELFRSSR